MSNLSILEAAKYILEQLGETTAMKLQKLTFYVKAWSLVWDEDEMFPEEFQAWANGAVSPFLYDRHRGMFKVTPNILSDIDSNKLSDNQKDTINSVLSFYGEFTAQQLSDINHQEYPWKKARGDLPPEARSTNVVSIADMAEYYSGLWIEMDEQKGD
jgi:uncharacterized phage-associated protein